MFHPLGLFKQIECPNKHECDLQHCIFSHELHERHPGSNGELIYDPLSAGDNDHPPAKRRRVETPETDLKARRKHDTDQSSIILDRQEPPKQSLPNSGITTGLARKFVAHQTNQLSKSGLSSHPQSINRSVSPPPSKRALKPTVAEQAEKLIPRPVAKAPAILKVRMSFIELLHKQMHALKSQHDGRSDVAQTEALSDQHIIRWVLDEEEQAAIKSSSDIYRNTMSHKVLQLKKMKPEDWHKFVSDKIHSITSNDTKPHNGAPGLSPDEEIHVLKYVRTNLAGLDAHGYVTKAPSPAEVQRAKDAVKAAGGYEVCDRCGTRFQVFPGRDDQGRLTTKGECHYHWAKLNRGQRQKTDHITGQAQAGYPCCGQLPGSEGCTQAATHVFKVTDPKRMAALLPFEHTPAKADGKERIPVAFDCEMAYTTYGMELVRLTAVSWPHNNELLDVLVRPYGEILDLNTRFSGVSKEQYANAVAYAADQLIQTKDLQNGEKKAGPICKVDSVAIARQLMFELLSPETPLIGHAIDNDLNTCRMIHPFVVDTVLLFPHPRGLPIRFGLKMLTSQYLHRSIQTGGDAGHDSKEDSIATGDLVKIKVAEKWQMMRLQGWKFQQGSLVPPGR